MLSASANKLPKLKEQAGEYAALIMEALDPNNLGYIMIQQLETLLLQDPIQSAVKSGNYSHSLSQALSQKLAPTKVQNPLRRCSRKIKYFLEDNWKRVWIILLWFLMIAGLFTWKFIQYKNRAVYHVMGFCVCTAKGAAETLKLNMALILLPVCRNTITWLRLEPNWVLQSHSMTISTSTRLVFRYNGFNPVLSTVYFHLLDCTCCWDIWSFSCCSSHSFSFVVIAA